MITRPFALGPEFDTLPNDTEETLMGTSWHQAAIVALDTSLRQCGPWRGLSWFVGNQIKVVIPRQGRGGPYMPSPDILVHPTLGSGSRTSIYLAVDGPPALVIEVASPSTALEHAVNLTAPTGKSGVYEAIGVSEYLVFDPGGEILDPPVWGRRTSPNGFVPWEPGAVGRWVSDALGIAFEPQGALLRVYDQDGDPVRFTEELADLVEEQESQLIDRDRLLLAREQRLTDQDRRLAELEEELRKLRGA